MSRRCQNRYRPCQNPAVSGTGSTWDQRLCSECLARRKEKQRATASQPTCRCGSKAALGRSQCRRCDPRPADRSAAVERCHECNGEGYLIKQRFFGLWLTQERCAGCHGIGITTRGGTR